MRTKDITLSASLIGSYIAILLIGSTSPIKIAGIITSALFGLFWPYFSIRLNLIFCGLRVSWNMINYVRKGPALIRIIAMEGIAGIEFMKWMNIIKA